MRQTRDHILNVSFSLFLQKSYKEVTMQEIVTKSGMSKGAFYHYFESKEQIFREILDSQFSSAVFIDYSRFSRRSLYEFYHDYIKNLQRLGETFLDVMGGNEIADINYYSLMFDAMRLFPDYRSKVVESSLAELAEWRSIVHAARENAEIRSAMSDAQIASIFLNTNGGLSMNNIMMNRMVNIMQDLTELWDGFYQEIKS